MMWRMSAVFRPYVLGCLFTLAVLLGGTAAQAAAPKLILRAAAETTYSPFSTTNREGQVTGFAVELLRASAEAMGAEVEIRTGTWSELLSWLRYDTVDVLPLMGRTLEREEIYDFSFSYVTLNSALVIRKDEQDIHSLEDLRDHSVAAQVNGTSEMFLRQSPQYGVALLGATSTQEALEWLKAGKCDAVMLQQLVARQAVDSPQYANLKIADRMVEECTHDFRFAVRKNNHRVLDLLNEGLSKTLIDGTYQRLYAKWLAPFQLTPQTTLLCGGHVGFPPWEFIGKDGKPDGYNIELAHAVADALGHSLKYQTFHGLDSLRALDAGEIDLLTGFPYSDEAAEKYEFSAPMVTTHFIAAVRHGETPPVSLAELKGHRVAVERGGVLPTLMAKSGVEMDIRLTSSVVDSIAMLRAGDCDVVVAPRLTLIALELEVPKNSICLGNHSLCQADYCFAAQKGRRALISSFSEGLRLVQASGEYRRIQEKWLFELKPLAKTVSMRRLLQLVLYILVPVLIGMILLLGVLWSLRRTVARRTKELNDVREVQSAILSSTPVALYAFDMGGKLLFWNAAAERMFGWLASEVVGEDNPLIPPNRETEWQQEIDCNFDVVHNGIEWNALCKDGNTIPVSSAIAPLRDSSGRQNGIMVATTDIRERLAAAAEKEQLQNRLNQMWKMESLGQLAGGIAHDFNNLLQVISGFSELATDRIPADNPAQTDLTEISAACGRASSLVQQLLIFSRQQPLEMRDVSLNRILDEMVKMISRVLGEQILLKVCPGNDTGFVHADTGQLGQIIINLCVNARDAMPGGGTLTLETRREDFDEAACRDRPWAKPGHYAVLSVTDTGCGMSSEVLRRIFDPFFTTKGLGKGTGLGLSIVYTLVQQHNGLLHVETAPNRGSSFHIYLPRMEGHEDENTTAAPNDAAEVEAEEEAIAGAVILLAEDNASVRELAQTILESEGYTVICAADGEETIELFTLHRDRIQLAILDIIMPNRNGYEVYNVLHTMRPELPVLFASGYSNMELGVQLKSEDRPPLIPKPYVRQDLLSHVHQALRERKAAPPA